MIYLNISDYTGSFICTKFKGTARNDWHYVKITKTSGNQYKWTNKVSLPFLVSFSRMIIDEFFMLFFIKYCHIIYWLKHRRQDVLGHLQMTVRARTGQWNCLLAKIVLTTNLGIQCWYTEAMMMVNIYLDLGRKSTFANPKVCS